MLFLLAKSPKNRSSDCKLSFVVIFCWKDKMDVIEDTLIGQTHFDKTTVLPPAAAKMDIT